MRDRLIELLKEVFDDWYAYLESCFYENKNADVDFDEFFADHILANGVVALPCKVGQIVWLCTSPENIRSYDFDGDGKQKEIFECVVENITFYSSGIHQVRCYCNGKFVAHYLRFSEMVQS